MRNCCEEAGGCVLIEERSMVGVVYGGLGWLNRERDWGTSGGETRRFSSVRWWGIEDEVLLMMMMMVSDSPMNERLVPSFRSCCPGFIGWSPAIYGNLLFCSCNHWAWFLLDRYGEFGYLIARVLGLDLICLNFGIEELNWWIGILILIARIVWFNYLFELNWIKLTKLLDWSGIELNQLETVGLQI